MPRQTQEDKRLKRRDLLIGAGLVGIAAGWQVWGVRDPELRFVPIADVPGWRFGQAGEVSTLTGTDLMTVGLETRPAPLPVVDLDRIVHQTNGPAPRLAVFGDFFCPYCRILMARVRTMTDVSVTWHELPLLGPSSVKAARAAEAARLQNGYLAFYDELTRSGFRPSDRYMSAVAGAAGLDGARLRADMDGPEVALRLAQSAAAATRLGFFATPALVIEHTAILGALPTWQLETLLRSA